MKYSSINYYVMMPRSTMTSCYLMKISTGIYDCKNDSPTSHSSSTYPYYLCNKVTPIIIMVDVSVATSENYSV